MLSHSSYAVSLVQEEVRLITAEQHLVAGSVKFELSLLCSVSKPTPSDATAASKGF